MIRGGGILIGQKSNYCGKCYVTDRQDLPRHTWKDELVPLQVEENQEKNSLGGKILR